MRSNELRTVITRMNELGFPCVKLLKNYFSKNFLTILASASRDSCNNFAIYISDDKFCEVLNVKKT